MRAGAARARRPCRSSSGPRSGGRWRSTTSIGLSRREPRPWPASTTAAIAISADSSGSGRSSSSTTSRCSRGPSVSSSRTPTRSTCTWVIPSGSSRTPAPVWRPTASIPRRRAGWSSRPSRHERRADGRRGSAEARLRARGRRAGPLHGSDAGVLPGAGLQPVPLGALHRRAVHPARQAAGPRPDRSHHDRRAVSAGGGRPGAARGLQRGREVLQVLLRAGGPHARSPDLARRLRPHEHRAGRPRRLLAAAPPARGGRGWPDRQPDRALPRGADQSQPPGDDGDRRARAAAPLSGGRRRRGAPGPQLTSLPPDRESGRPAPGDQRRLDGDHGLRPRHRGALRRAALRVERLPARQLGGPALRRGIPGPDPRAGSPVARGRACRADHGGVAAHVDEGPRLEAEVPRRGQALAGRDRRAPQGIRRREGGGEGQARGLVSKTFAGVRILAFTPYLAGPYGTYQLPLLGADVIKIESQEGDETRISPADRTWAERKMAPSFLSMNGNKRSITLALRRKEAIEIVKRLVIDADVVWENFRGGVMDRLGLGYEALSAINPRLIYCGVSGFGRTGPEKTTAAFDGKLQAMS